MPEEAQVWISSRKCKKGKSYHLRWLDPSTGRMKSRKAGTDRKRADREAALLERELEEGTFHLVRKAGWSQFVEDHVAKIPGRRNAVEAARTLKEFGKVCKVTGPRFVTFSTIERYVAHLRREDDQKKANSVATINKKLRYLRAAFNMAVKRGYAKANPMDGWRWDREDEKAIRIVSDVEEIAILNAAEAAYGFRWWAFIPCSPKHRSTPWRASVAVLGLCQYRGCLGYVHSDQGEKRPSCPVGLGYRTSVKATPSADTPGGWPVHWNGNNG